MIDREHWEKMLPIIQAFVNGQTVQHKSGEGDEWIDLEEEAYFDGCPVFYRIKPEPKYRPFKTTEECWQEMLKHQPFGWIKPKENKKERVHIGRIFEVANNLLIALSIDEVRDITSSYLFSAYTFDDGAPFGVKEE